MTLACWVELAEAVCVVVDFGVVIVKVVGTIFVEVMEDECDARANCQVTVTQMN